MPRGPTGVDLPFKLVLTNKRAYEADDTPMRLAWLNIRNIVPQAWAEYRIRLAVDHAKRDADRYGTPVFAWSAGKDSIALDVVMERAGIERGVMGWCSLEFTEFREWVAANAPPGVVMIENEVLTEEYIVANRRFVFPPLDGADAHRYTHMHFRTPVIEGYRRLGAGVLFRGHRIQDKNRDTRAGYGMRYSNPIVDWTHEEVMAAIRYGGRSLPPCYGYPMGWFDGPSTWNYRTAASPDAGWRETYDIEPAIVGRMAPHFEGARRELDRRNNP